MSTAEALDHGHRANKRLQLLAMQVSFMSAATFVVALRLFTRYVILRSPGWEDWAISFALVVSIAETSMTLSCLNHGAGRELQSTADQSYTLNVFYAAWILYSVAIASIRLSVCLLYLRLFPTLWMRRCTKGIIATCTIGCVTLLFLWVTMCKPSSMASNKKEPRTCLKRGGLFEAHSIFGLCINLAIIILPMPTIWGLHMPIRRRLLVMGVFAIGLIPCASLIARLVLFASAAEFSSDPTWWISKTENWVLAEYSSGLICASLIHLKPIVKMLIPCLLDSPHKLPENNRQVRPFFSERKYSRISHPSDRRYGNLARACRRSTLISEHGDDLTEIRPLVRVTARSEDEGLLSQQPRSPERVLTWAPKTKDRSDTCAFRHTYPQ